MERRKAEKQTKKNPGLFLAVFVFVLVLAYILISAYIGLTKTKIPEVEIILGQVDKPKTLKGIVFRNENVYKASVDGFLSFQLHHKEKVKHHGVIARIENEEQTFRLKESIAEVESQLSKEKMALSSQAYPREVKKLNKQMQELSNKNASYLLMGQTGSVYSFKEKLSQHLELRNQAFLTSVNSSDSEIYLQEREKMATELLEAASVVYADTGGILSYYVDGYEDILTVDKRDSLSKESFLEIEMPLTQASGGHVKAEDLICKIVKDHTWYVVSYIPSHLVKGWEVGKEKKIFVEREEGFEEEVFYIHALTEIDDEDTYVIFAQNKYVQDFIEDRVLSIRLSEELKEGYQVPVKAIVDKTLAQIPLDYLEKSTDKNKNTFLVYKNTSEGIKPVEVYLSYEDEFNAYIEVDYKNIKLEDVLYHPEDKNRQFTLTQIDNVKGVYITNTGITTFQKIDLEGSVSTKESTYVILVPEKNKKLKVHDKIVADVEQVTERQSIY